MKSNNVAAFLTWYIVFVLTLGFVLFAQVFRSGIEVHWSQLILITAIAPIVPTYVMMKLFPVKDFVSDGGFQ